MTTGGCGLLNQFNRGVELTRSYTLQLLGLSSSRLPKKLVVLVGRLECFLVIWFGLKSSENCARQEFLSRQLRILLPDVISGWSLHTFQWV